MDRHFTLSTADLLYISSVTALDQEDEKAKTRAKLNRDPETMSPVNDLMRYQFIEALLRIAKCKFIETNICTNFVPALTRFFKEHYEQFKLYTRPWQDFREEELWSLDSNDLFTANKEGLETLFKRLCAKRRKYITYKDSLRFMQGKHPITSVKKKTVKEEELLSPKSPGDEASPRNANQ